jgi:hypothetical protein
MIFRERLRLAFSTLRVKLLSNQKYHINYSPVYNWKDCSVRNILISRTEICVGLQRVEQRFCCPSPCYMFHPLQSPTSGYTRAVGGIKCLVIHIPRHHLYTQNVAPIYDGRQSCLQR